MWRSGNNEFRCNLHNHSCLAKNVAMWQHTRGLPDGFPHWELIPGFFPTTLHSGSVLCPAFRKRARACSR
jgi:hypothetical protein